jgi:hypothetical protein
MIVKRKKSITKRLEMSIIERKQRKKKLYDFSKEVKRLHSEYER